MKKLLAAFLCALLLLSPAFADEAVPDAAPTEPADAETAPAVPDEPSLTYPKDRYGDIYMEETDGSEQTVFMLLDFLNSEEDIIAESGCLVITTEYYTDGAPLLTMVMRNFYANGARCSLTTVEGISDYCLFFIEDACYVSNGGAVEEQDSSTVNNMALWDLWLYPYNHPTVLHGIRQTDGFTYYLASCGDGSAIEYVTGDDIKIVENRVYYPDDAGELVLTMVVRYSGEAQPEVPEEFLTYFPETTAAPDAA